MLPINSPAPNFSLPDQNGKIHRLSDYKKQYVLIYFYPKDDTPGCTKEACNFRDATKDFKQLGVRILGISKDGVNSHKKFSEKYRLNFPLLADPETAVIKKYHAWGEKKFMGKTFSGTLRISYLIGKNGKILKIYPKVNPLTHAHQVKQDVMDLQ